MAKRFIDTALFEDPWFFELSKDGKLAWIFLITRCNHAGIFDISFKIAEFQTKIKSFETVIKQLGNRLVTVSENKYFIPKFILYQYPNGLFENVKAQKSVIDLLKKYNIDYQNIKQLPNSLITVQDKDKDKDILINVKKPIFELNEFYDNELEKIKDIDKDNLDFRNKIDYKNFLIYLFDLTVTPEKTKIIGNVKQSLLKLDVQMSYKDFKVLNEFADENEVDIYKYLDAMENYKPLTAKNKDMHLTCMNWIRKDLK